MPPLSLFSVLEPIPTTLSKPLAQSMFLGLHTNAKTVRNLQMKI